MNATQLDTIRSLARRIRKRNERLGYSWEDLAQDAAIRAWIGEPSRRGNNWIKWAAAIVRQRDQLEWRRERVRLRETSWASSSEHAHHQRTPLQDAIFRELLLKHDDGKRGTSSPW